MKHLHILVFGIVLLQAFAAGAQDHYLFPPGTQLYDLPGDDFLTYHIADNKVYLEKRDVTGTVLWSDSLNNDGALDADQFYIQRFGQTSDYRVLLEGNFTSDSMIVLHATLSLADGQLQAFRTDTLHGYYYISTCSPADTAVYLFTNRGIGNDTYMHDVFSISTGGDLTPVTAVTTHPTHMYNYRFFSRAGGIYELYNNYGDLYSRQFDLQLQPLAGIDSTDCIEEYNFGAPLLKQLKGDDSLFVLYYAYDFSAYNEAWVFAWFTPELEELLVYDHVYSTTPDPYYSLDFNDVVLTSEYIYLLSYYMDGPPLPPARRMFVYDHAFQPVCDYETAPSTDNHLTLLNNETYIIQDDNNGVELFRATVCGIFGQEEQSILQLSVFPNPAKGNMMVTFEPGSIQTLEVGDLSGKRLLQLTSEQFSEGTAVMDLSGLDNGIYWVRAAGAVGIAVERITLSK